MSAVGAVDRHGPATAREHAFSPVPSCAKCVHHTLSSAASTKSSKQRSQSLVPATIGMADWVDDTSAHHLQRRESWETPQKDTMINALQVSSLQVQHSR